jgi:hypothetical protein
MKRLIPALMLAAIGASSVAAPSHAGFQKPRYMLDDYGNVVQTYDDDGDVPRRCFRYRIAVVNELGDVVHRWKKDCESREVRWIKRRPIREREIEKDGREPSGQDRGDNGESAPGIR